MSMWILGGKLDQFTFINEHASNAPTYFSYQHDVEVLPNGDITLFDNGNQHSPTLLSRCRIQVRCTEHDSDIGVGIQAHTGYCYKFWWVSTKTS